MTRHTRVVLTAILTATVLAGCGIGPETVARPLQQTSHARTPPSDLPATNAAGGHPEKLYLVEDNTLVPIVRRVSRPPTPGDLLHDLAAGPTPAEADGGVTTALLTSDLLGQVHTANRVAVIPIESGLDDSGRNDQVLAFGQIVCTITQYPGIEAVTFTRAAQPISVPRGDGSLTTAPLSAADYASLLGR